MPKYVINKQSRAAARTYTGPTWEAAGLLPPTLRNGMERHADFFYASFEEAESDAAKLRQFNCLDYIVDEVCECGCGQVKRVCALGPSWEEGVL